MLLNFNELIKMIDGKYLQIQIVFEIFTISEQIGRHVTYKRDCVCFF